MAASDSDGSDEYGSAREKFLGLSLESTRKSYYPQLLAQNATQLTRQLLGFVRGGKYEVKPIDMNPVMLNSAQMFGRTHKEIRIHTRCSQHPPVVEADQGQIEQALLNMYLNAWQAMPDGGDLFL